MSNSRSPSCIVDFNMNSNNSNRKSKRQYGRVISDEGEKVEKLVNIASFCPDVILSNARKRRDLDQLLCDDPIANEFIKLDSEMLLIKMMKT